MSDETKNPAVEVASEIVEEGDNIYLLDDGTQVKLSSVPAAVIDAVVSKIKPPEVPLWHNNENDRDEPNPNDPNYLKAVADVDRQRTTAMIDAAIMFGIKLVNGMPKEAAEELFEKLQFMERLGQLSLSSYDLTDAKDAEFVYKKFSAPMWMINEVQKLSSITQEDVDRAKRSFRGKKTR